MVLYLGVGALTQTAGQTLTLVSARGYTTTITTSAATVFLRAQAGSPGDITDGAQVRVTVASSGGATTATTVMISPELMAIGPDPVSDNIVYGRVADASTVGFTLVRSDLRRSQVTITSATTVIMPARIRESQLRLDVATIAMGVPGAGGALTANTVEQFAVPAAIPPFYASE
jgi:hypothetical protein